VMHVNVHKKKRVYSCVVHSIFDAIYFSTEASEQTNSLPAERLRMKDHGLI